MMPRRARYSRYIALCADDNVQTLMDYVNFSIWID